MSTDQTALQALLDALVGRRIEGGCPDCISFAYITSTEPGVYDFSSYHASTCPRPTPARDESTEENLHDRT